MRFSKLIALFCVVWSSEARPQISSWEQTDVASLVAKRLVANKALTWKLDSSVGDENLRMFVENTSTQKRWVVVARLSHVNLEARMQQNGKRLAVSEQSPNCKVAINAGYFNTRTGVSTSIVVENGELTGRDEQAIARQRGTGYPTRSVLGRDTNGWQMRWGRSVLTGVQSFLAPANPWIAPRAGKAWNVQNAVGGGPMLLADGKKRITASEELFDAESGVSPDGFHGRTAVGLDNSAGLVFFLISDGRRPDAKGSSMDDLASILLSFGAQNAMNFDGGGSSTLVVDGRVVNKPSDGVERPVVSILCLAAN